MDIRQIQCFLALADTLHFGYAAARMNMTQPPFSRQIANLERNLGVTLFRRSSRRVQLTSAGQQFLRDATRIMAELEAACQDARLVAEGKSGTLRLGFMMHAAHRIVPDLVSRFSALCPDVRLSLIEATPGELEPRLLSGDLDAALTFAGHRMSAVTSLPVLSDRLCLVVPKGHPLQSHARISPGDLLQEQLIAAPYDVSPTLHRAIMGFLAQGGVTPSLRFEPRLQHSILHLVAAGLGVALVPESISVSDPAIIARPLTKPPELKVVVMYRQTAENPALRAFCKMVRDGFERHQG